MTSDTASLSLDTALPLLRLFVCVDRLADHELPDNDRVRQAVLLVREHSDYQIFGICADSQEQAIAALHSYLQALDYPEQPQLIGTIDGPVYLKFNPKTGRSHLDTYIGEHRGVLLSCQSAYDGDVNETFGHLPLDLWTQKS
jgi:hypothetical protein